MKLCIKQGLGDAERDGDDACMHTHMHRAFTLHISVSPSSSNACPVILIKMLTTKKYQAFIPETSKHN
jgi:hypothetical protein